MGSAKRMLKQSVHSGGREPGKATACWLWIIQAERVRVTLAHSSCFGNKLDQRGCGGGGGVSPQPSSAPWTATFHLGV